MGSFLTITQTVISILLIVLILIQAKGTGLGRTFGGGASFSRRGLEKFIFKFTFVLAGLFLLVSILQLVI